MTLERKNLSLITNRVAWTFIFSAQNNLEAIQIISLAKNYHMSKNDPTMKIPKIKGPRNSYAGVLICVGGRGNEGDPYKSVEYLEGKFCISSKYSSVSRLESF